MWFIWIMWVIVAIAIIATIILLTGKGSMLVSGFNTKSPEERAKYDKEKVSKQTWIAYDFRRCWVAGLDIVHSISGHPGDTEYHYFGLWHGNNYCRAGYLCIYHCYRHLGCYAWFENCKNDGTKQ